ncbi:MAG: polysaccharide biosynthesis tyrosine autokinase [Syntrophobacteraceae bacterium]|nr:polysaccharide biosynthesis tyrosine autokinase [Desulfobacteraceae bacterium]
MNSSTDIEPGQGSLVRSKRTQYPSTELVDTPARFDYSPGLHDFFDILVRRKRVIVIVFLCIFCPALAYNLMVSPIYQAQGWLELSGYPAHVTKFEDIADPLNKRGDEFVQTQIQLLQSTTLARRVADRVRLADHPLFNPEAQSGKDRNLLTRLKGVVGSITGTVKNIPKSIAKWVSSDKPEDGPVDSTRGQIIRQKALEGYIVGGLLVTLQTGSDVASITFDSEDPALARDIINALIEEFVVWQMDRKIDAGKVAKRQLEEQIVAARSGLEHAENEFNDYAKKEGIVSLDTKMNIIFQQLEEINTSLAKIQSDRIQKEENYRYASNNDLNSNPIIQQSNLITNLRQQYLMLSAEYSKLDVKYKEEFPTVKAIKGQMREIESKIKTEQQRILNTIKNDYMATAMAEQALQDSAKEKKGLALNMRDLASRYKVLERQVDVNNKIYQSLLERSKEIDANVGTDLTNVKVVDFASLPLEKAKPKVARNLLMALMLGMVAGVGLALILEHLDDSIRRVDEIPRRYWVPVLGVVPMVENSDRRSLMSFLNSMPSTAFSESIRMIRVSIQRSNSYIMPLKSLLLTSSRKGEGKSTLSANLAQAFAASNERVLLIEADLRRPSLDRYFCKNGKARGISEYLNGNCKYEEIIQKTGIPNLSMIPAGKTPFNPSELIASQNMKDLLETAASHFDRIILDGPPFSSDALALSNQVNGIILVATLGQTQREGLRIFCEGLTMVQGKLLGGIVNMLKANGYYGAKYYGHYYSEYGCSHKDEKDGLPVVIDHS